MEYLNNAEVKQFLPKNHILQIGQMFFKSLDCWFLQNNIISVHIDNFFSLNQV